MTVYRIKNERTGLFSLGGWTPRWGKTGKLWFHKGRLKSHLNGVLRHQQQRNAWRVHEGKPAEVGIPPEWTIIAYELADVNSQKIPANQFQ